MISVQVLEDADIVKPDMLCRPLVLEWSEDGDIREKATFGGTPINNLQWVPVRVVLGPGWWHKPLSHIRKGCNWNYEVIETEIALPTRHRLKYGRTKVS